MPCSPSGHVLLLLKLPFSTNKHLKQPRRLCEVSVKGYTEWKGSHKNQLNTQDKPGIWTGATPGSNGGQKRRAHFNLKSVPKPYGNWMKKMASKKRRMHVNLRSDRNLKILVICPPTAPTSCWEGAFMSKDSASTIRGFREAWPDWWSPCRQEILGKEVLTQESSDKHKSMSNEHFLSQAKPSQCFSFMKHVILVQETVHLLCWPWRSKRNGLFF